MLKVSTLIKSGAVEFLRKEYTFLLVFCGLFAVLIYITVDMSFNMMPYTTSAFLIGALTSMICGYIGMLIAVHTNVRTTWACCDSIDAGFRVAFKGGQVLGFSLVGLALLVLHIIVLVYIRLLQEESYDSESAA